MKYENKQRTRGTFTLTGLEHRGARAGHERLASHIQGDSGLLVLWGTAGKDMRHISALERRVKERRYTVTIECDWITPDSYEAEHFGHRYWVWESDHFEILD